MSKDKGIHPAIVELRKYLHLKGDVNLLAFMQRWMASWLDVGYYSLELTAEEIETLKHESQEKREQFYAFMDKKAHQDLGKLIGPKCAQKEEEPDLTNDTVKYHYAVMVFLSEKKVLLDSG